MKICLVFLGFLLKNSKKKSSEYGLLSFYEHFGNFFCKTKGLQLKRYASTYEVVCVNSEVRRCCYNLNHRLHYW